MTPKSIMNDGFVLGMPGDGRNPFAYHSSNVFLDNRERDLMSSSPTPGYTYPSSEALPSSSPPLPKWLEGTVHDRRIQHPNNEDPFNLGSSSPPLPEDLAGTTHDRRSRGVNQQSAFDLSSNTEFDMLGVSATKMMDLPFVAKGAVYKPGTEVQRAEARMLFILKSYLRNLNERYMGAPHMVDGRVVKALKAMLAGGEQVDNRNLKIEFNDQWYERQNERRVIFEILNYRVALGGMNEVSDEVRVAAEEILGWGRHGTNAL